jgi:hypothetical protein
MEMWQEHLPGVPVRLDSQLMLPPPQPAAPHNPDQPVTVVVIGGGSVMGRLPAVPLAAHRESYRRLFLALSEMGDEVDVIFKPKGVWLETAAWLHQVVGSRASFRVASAHPLRIDHPNMVFVTVSFGSSALLEGMSRGIPAMIVRDFPVEDYTTIDTSVVSTGTTDEIIAEIHACIDPAHRQRLIDRQSAYYRREIGFDE